MKKRAQQTKSKQKQTPTQNTVSAKSVARSILPEQEKAGTVYKDFSVYDGTHAPKWHPTKKMRYVFYRMIAGCTVTDALHEIHWNAAEFWHLVDLKRHGPFREEYKRAKVLQGRALADHIVAIAEGRDRVSRTSRKRLEKLLSRTMKRAAKTKNAFKAKLLMQQLVNDLRENERDVIARNKLQIESTKWLATKVNPSEFGEKSTVALTPADGDGDTKAKPFVVQFVGPDGKAVSL